jgi:hypothetical protein
LRKAVVESVRRQVVLFRGRKRVHCADDIMANIAAERVVAHLDSAGFVMMRKPPSVGAAPLAVGFEPPGATTRN